MAVWKYWLPTYAVVPDYPRKETGLHFRETSGNPEAASKVPFFSF